MSSIKTLITAFLVIFTAIYQCNGYFLSPTRYDWHNASLFCQQHCNSELASIHTINDQNEASGIIMNSVSYPSVITASYDIDDVWIGLKWDTNSNQYLWTDGSLFDFGSPPTTSIYPWSSLQPDYSSDYVALSKLNSYLWRNHPSTNVRLRPLCNSCDSQLAKYVFMERWYTWNEAEHLCVTTGTHSASVHSVRDQHEVVTTLNRTYPAYGNNVWIGLTDTPTPNSWHWTDNTTFDFGNNISGGIYPWGQFGKEPNGDDEHCGELLANYQWDWNDQKCANTINVICNIHSEICNPFTTWIVGFGSPNRNDNECDGWVISEELAVEASCYRISNKQWVNYNKLLVIDYMFQLKKLQTKPYGLTGVILWNLMNEYEFYVIYVSQDASGWHISIGKWLSSSNWNTLKSALLPSTMSSDKFYMLTGKIQNGNSFELLLNGISYLNYTDESEYNLRGKDSILSGSIGIYIDDATATVKSLFVSGGWTLDDMPPTSPPTLSPTRSTEAPSNPTKMQ